MTEIRNSILAGLAFGVLFGLFVAVRFGIEYALIGGPISGLCFGAIVYLFVKSDVVAKQTSIDVDENGIVHSGGANHFMNGEAVGGKLYLLADKLQFQSHSFNIQNHSLEIPLKEIVNVDFYRTLGIVPNGLQITYRNGEVEKFVVNDKALWKAKIEKLHTTKPKAN